MVNVAPAMRTPLHFSVPWLPVQYCGLPVCSTFALQGGSMTGFHIAGSSSLSPPTISRFAFTTINTGLASVRSHRYFLVRVSIGVFFENVLQVTFFPLSKVSIIALS